MKNKLKEWLINQQSVLDTIIANAAVQYYKSNKDQANFSYDLKKCHEESYNLIRGKDLCYDRANTAFAYSLWYHARRVNTFLSFYTDKLFELQGQNVEIFDLGAGAGAVQWAVGLVYSGLKHLGLQPPRITIINIDTSPFMLIYCRDYLWKNFCNHYLENETQFKVRYSVNSWNNEENLETSNPWLVSSYLFDISDNKNDVANDFLKLVNKYKPNTVLLLTSCQAEKKIFLQTLRDVFVRNGYNSQLVEDNNLLFNSSLTSINSIRLKLGINLNVEQLKRAATWTDYSYSGLILTKSQIQLNFGSKTNNVSSINIFSPPITVRRDVKLNPKQLEAAENTDRAVVIVGPAGCGKSIVITERIKNIVNERNYDTELTILLTTFNKGLIGKLSEWIKDILDSNKYSFRNDRNFYGYSEKSCHFTFKGSNKTNIRLLHFDMLPKYLGDIRYRGLVEKEKHLQVIANIIYNLKVEESILDDRFDNLLNPEFIFEEYHRVVYGLQYFRKEQYIEEKRVGRGSNPSLPRGSKKREYIWICIIRYYKFIKQQNMQSFITRRQEFLTKLRKEELDIKFDYILVDEFQDCTNADFEIFFRMLDNPDKLVLAGDLAQAVHIGKTARIPRDERMSRRRFYRLEGSYRLPVRISECIRKLSEKIVETFSNEEGVNSITPYKASPPGARPIVVYGETVEGIGKKLKDVFQTYKIYDLKKVCILEKDDILNRQLNQLGVSSETDTILSLKGLEKECIIWSTRIPLEYEKEVYEFVYTILTRTSSILIIALSDRTQDLYMQVLGLLDRERLIFWDKESEDKFDSFCEPSNATALIDED